MTLVSSCTAVFKKQSSNIHLAVCITIYITNGGSSTYLTILEIIPLTQKFFLASKSTLLLFLTFIKAKASEYVSGLPQE